MVLPVTWSLDGLDFNTSADEYGNLYVVESERGWSGTGLISGARVARFSGHGSYRSPVYRPGRVIELTGWVHCPTWQGRQAAEFRLAALCQNPYTLYPLIRSDHGLELVSHVELDNPIDPIIRPGGRVLDFSIQVASVDYRKFSRTAHSSSTGLPTAASGGVLWNGSTGTTGLSYSPGVLWQSNASSAGVIQANNAGTAPADVILTISGPIVGPTITAGENVIQWLGTVGTGSQLVINTGSGSVLLDGANRGTELTRADWFQIPAQGSQDIIFSSTDPDNSVGAQLTVTIYDAYA